MQLKITINKDKKKYTFYSLHSLAKMYNSFIAENPYGNLITVIKAENTAAYIIIQENTVKVYDLDFLKSNFTETYNLIKKDINLDIN
jgi:hypothetical protein